MKRKGKQMIRKDKKQGQQNKGFTLLEVLVAITILSIIVVPLLQAFVTSAGVNAKARREMNATSVAENVIEELKAGTLEDTALQFNGAAEGGFTEMTDAGNLSEVIKYTDAVNGTYTYGAPDSSKTTYPSVMDTDPSVENTKMEFVGQTSNEYHFQMKSVKMDSSSFDVAIHLTPNVNGTKNLANVNSMNDASCGYYVEDEDLALRAAETFQMRNAAYVYKEKTAAKVDVETLMAEMSREITITVNAESVDVTYTYTVSSAYTDAGQNTYTETVRIFENTFSEEELKAVYLYYNPLHKKTDVETKTDTILIDNINGTKRDLEVFLIKMDAENPIGTNGYASTTDIVTSNSGNAGNKKLQICTNITTPLIMGDGGIVKTLSNVTEIVSLYDVEVEVFSHADSNPFAEDNLIDTYTGSFLDKTE